MKFRREKRERERQRSGTSPIPSRALRESTSTLNLKGVWFSTDFVRHLLWRIPLADQTPSVCLLMLVFGILQERKRRKPEKTIELNCWAVPSEALQCPK